MTVFVMLVSMLCLISCSNNGEKQGIHSDGIEMACSDVDSFLGSDIDTDTVATKHGVYMFRRCLNDSVYVHCIAGSIKTIFAFSCYHGGYSIDVVDHESGGVGFTISESGYGHSQEDAYKVKFVDGIGTCISALTTSEYSLYSSDPEKFYSYGVDILADTLLIEHLEDESKAIKTSSRVKMQYANSECLFYTDIIDTDTLLVLLDGEVIPLMANARVAFVKLNEYEYCRFQNIWYRRRHSEKTSDEPVFMPMYNWISARR